MAQRCIWNGFVLAVILASFSTASEAQTQHVSSASCSQHASSFAYIVERIAGSNPQLLMKSDVCGDCSESTCVVQFADSAASANQSSRVQAINTAWFQLQHINSVRSRSFEHYLLIIEGAKLITTSSSIDSPLVSSTILRDFEQALLGAEFLVAVPSLHLPSRSPASQSNATSPVLNPFASGILAAKARAAFDLFPLATVTSLGSDASGSSDVGFALSAASIIAHRKFGSQFISTSLFSVHWLRAPPFGIGPSSFLLSLPAEHPQLCSLYNSFIDLENSNLSFPAHATSPFYEQSLQQVSQLPAFASNNASAAPSAHRAPNCCHLYWRRRSACDAFNHSQSCPPHSTPLFCHMKLDHYSHKWAYEDGTSPPSTVKKHLHLASLPPSAFSFSSVFCHDNVTGNCSCGVDACGSNAVILRHPQLESMSAWTPHDQDPSPWLQMDFGEVTKMIGVITRARRDELQWVRTFKVTASNSSNSTSNSWIDVGSFLGNIDPHNQKVNMFPSPVFARFIRIYPTSAYSFRSLRTDIVIDSITHSSKVYAMPNLFPPPSHLVLQSLRGKRILMIGDSHTRFHYLHFAHWICFQQQAGTKFVEDMFWQNGNLDWQSYDEKWDEFFRESTFAFDGQQMCDCHRPASWREFGYEIRVTRCAGVEITFVLMYGIKSVLGRLPLNLGDFDLLSRSRAINSVLRCSAENRGCPKSGCSNVQQAGHFQAQAEELKAKLMSQVLNGEIDSDDMFNILETFEKSNTEASPHICKGSGGYAWHDAAYGKSGNGGVWELANLSHFLEVWSNATGGADVYFIGQGAHMDFENIAHIESILSSCSIATKNSSSSRCIWRSPRRKEVRFSEVDPVTHAIRSSIDAGVDWSIFRPDDILYHTPPELHVDNVGHLSGVANDVLNNGFIWFLWSLIGDK